MKFAAIADVHGNIAALEAVLADIAVLAITEVVNLGDHVSGPLEPRRTADLLMKCGFPSIRGNQDRVLVEKRAGMERAFRWLDDSHMQWLASLPATLLYRADVFLCHGTPLSDETYWLDRVTHDGTIAAAPIEDIEAEASGIAASLILCGHTHIPRVVRLRDGRLAVNAACCVGTWASSKLYTECCNSSAKRTAPYFTPAVHSMSYTLPAFCRNATRRSRP